MSLSVVGPCCCNSIRSIAGAGAGKLVEDMVEVTEMM